MRFSLTLVIAFASALPLLAANEPPSGGIESLGDELLQDLNAESPKQPGPRQAPSSRTPRFDDLGEDIGQPSGPLSLARVRQGMQQAETLLAANQAAVDSRNLQQAGEVQQRVVDQLDKLIAELSKQCQNCQGQSSDQPPKPSQRSQKKPGKSGSAAGRGQTAARDSTDRLNQANAQSVDKGDVEALMKDLWGHLPERTREQMMQSYSDEFLPEYELEIEQYYRRLSEDDDNLGSN
jgi:hypothetical protein